MLHPFPLIPLAIFQPVVVAYASHELYVLSSQLNLIVPFVIQTHSSDALNVNVTFELSVYSAPSLIEIVHVVGAILSIHIASNCTLAPLTDVKLLKFVPVVSIVVTFVVVFPIV